MSIKRLINDVFERVEFLDKNVENPFLQSGSGTKNTGFAGNPFAQFFGGTYVWIDPPENEK